jgi:hypothetical protein
MNMDPSKPEVIETATAEQLAERQVWDKVTVKPKGGPAQYPEGYDTHFERVTAEGVLEQDGFIDMKEVGKTHFADVCRHLAETFGCPVAIDFSERVPDADPKIIVFGGSRPAG